MLNVIQPTTALQDVNYLVVGLGVTGYSVARYLLSNGYRCRIQDTRDIPPFLGKLNSRFAAIDFRAQPLDAELIAWADVLVISPGLSIQQEAIQQATDLGKTVLGDIELFARVVAKPVIAITGSNGKSTVTTLVGEMIGGDEKSVAVGGNIGTAALDLLERNADFYVLELSSYQLETTTSLQPQVAALLNLCEDHLDRYPDYAAYIQAKLRIYNNARLCVSNFDDEVTRHDVRDVCFSLDPDADAEFRLLEEAGSEVLDAHTLREMHRVHWVDPDRGIGFGVQRDGNTVVVGHSGGCPGYTTNFQMITKEEIAVVTMTNVSQGPTGRLNRNLLNTIRPALQAAQSTPVETVPDFSMYEGNFDAHPWGGEMAIRQWGDQLVAITIPSDNLAMTKLKHVDGDTFVRLTDGGERRETWFFELGDDGRTQRVRYHDGYWIRIE